MNLPGFSSESLLAVAAMLEFDELDWDKQFNTGKRPGPQKKGNFNTGLKEAKGPAEATQKLLKGVKLAPSEGLSPVALPKGNPQQGPRSKTLDGLAMFEEQPQTCPPKKPQTPKPPQQQQANPTPAPPTPPQTAPTQQQQQQVKKPPCTPAPEQKPSS